MTDTRGWEAHITEDWQRRTDRLHLARHVPGPRLEMLTGFEAAGGCVLETIDPMITHNWAGLQFPQGALQAIANVMRPGPTHAELARLEEALHIERQRVDRALGKQLGER